MDMVESEFPNFAPLLDGAFAELAQKINERLYMSAALDRQRAAIPADGFYSWDAVKEFLMQHDSGIFRGGAISFLDAQTNILDYSKKSVPRWLMVGVSGGADSVCLLLFSVLAARIGSCSPIICCHVNHGMRGEESNGDAQFCERLSKSLGVHYVSTTASESAIEGFLSHGSEERFRDFRYDAFESHAAKTGTRMIALAHTLNDQVETVLFRSFRGTSSAGLRGIPCVRKHGKLMITRPLIDVSRDDIVSFLRHQGFPWREDSSNQQLHFKRNFIRTEIIPRIESEFSDFSQRIETMRLLVADDEEMLKALCLREVAEVEGKNANRWQLAKLEKLPNAIKRRMFAYALKARGIEVSFDRVDKLVAMSVGNIEFVEDERVKTAISLNEHWDVIRGENNLVFVEKDDFDAPQSAPVDPIAVRVPGMTIVPFLNKVMFVEPFESSEKMPEKFPPEAAFEVLASLEQVKGPLVLRERQPGDTIQPFGMNESVRLKKYLHTHKGMEKESEKDSDDSIGAARRRIFVLACEEEVFWIPGFGISEKLRVVGRPTHRLKLLDIGIADTALC